MQDDRIVILDTTGLIIFDAEKTNGIRLRKAAKLGIRYTSGGRKSGAAKFFGLYTSRRGEIGTYTNDGSKGHLLIWIQNTTGSAREMKIRESPIEFSRYEDDYVIGRPNPVIR